MKIVGPSDKTPGSPDSTLLQGSVDLALLPLFLSLALCFGAAFVFFAFWANKGEKGKTKAKNGRNRKKIIRGKRAAGPEAAVCHRATRGGLETIRGFPNELSIYVDLISDFFRLISAKSNNSWENQNKTKRCKSARRIIVALGCTRRCSTTVYWQACIWLRHDKRATTCTLANNGPAGPYLGLTWALAPCPNPITNPNRALNLDLTCTVGLGLRWRHASMPLCRYGRSCSSVSD